jgi:predicted dehydrogenase
MDSLNLALIGAGGISRAHVAAAKASNGRVRIAAVVDMSEVARKAVAESTGARSYASADEFFAEQAKGKSVDAVMICTPPSVRLPIVRQAIACGLHVFVEKPIASNTKDAQALVELAAANPKLVCAVGYCHRFTPAINEMKKRIDSGSLGNMLRFENTFACWFPAMKEKWFSDPAVSGGGSFIDTGCHSLDLYQYLLGNAKVVATTLQHEWSGRGESTATVLMRGTTHKSATAVIQSGWLEPARFIVTVVGTKGLLSYDYEKPAELQYKPSESNPETLAVETHEVRFDKQLLGFADAIEGKKNQIAGFGEGLTVAKWVEDALQAG